MACLFIVLMAVSGAAGLTVQPQAVLYLLRAKQKSRKRIGYFNSVANSCPDLAVIRTAVPFSF